MGVLYTAPSGVWGVLGRKGEVLGYRHTVYYCMGLSKKERAGLPGSGQGSRTLPDPGPARQPAHLARGTGPDPGMHSDGTCVDS